MSHHIETLQWFRENLDLQIEDLERQERDKAEIEFYFDTADIRDAVLGVQAFFPEHRHFDSDLFLESKTLVRCLLTSGWLGTVRMLPSHQAEFLSLMNINFGLGSEDDYLRDYPRRKSHFLDFVKRRIADKSKQTQIERLGEELAESELIEFVSQIKQQAKSAELLFKAVESVGRWRPRLARLMRMKSLCLEEYKFKYAEIVSSTLFQELKAKFDERRQSDDTINNFADAIAVASLIERVKHYREEGGKLPRFYVSTDLFREVIEMANVSAQLIYRDPEEGGAGREPSSLLTDPRGVLRDADYFIFKAAFGARQRADRPDQPLKPFGDMNLRQLRDAVVNILDAREPLSESAVDSIRVAGRSLNDIIQEVRRFSFLNNVWLQFIETNDIKKVRDLEAEARDLVEAKEVRKAIQATKEALEWNVKEYKKVKGIWWDLKQSSLDLQVRAGQSAAADIDIFRDLGLLRFSLPERVHGDVKHVLEAIMRGGEPEQRAARNYVITAYYSDNPKGELENLAIVSAVLWVAEMDKQLIARLEEVVEQRRPLPHYSLKMILAAAIFRSGRPQNKELGLKMLSELESEFSGARDSKRRIELGIGLAYLHYHYWWSLGYRPFWYPPSGSAKRDKAEEGRRLLLRAIDYSKHAYDLLRKDDMVRRVYVQNQYLFYLVMGGDESWNEEMDNAAGSLAAYKEDRDWWQYRCDDTLARYFHRRAVTAKTEEEWSSLVKKAYTHLDDAQRESHRDMDVERYYSIFSVDSLKRRHVSR